MSRFYYGEEITLPLPSGFKIDEDDPRTAFNEDLGTIKQFNNEWYMETEEAEPFEIEQDPYYYIFPAYTSYYVKLDIDSYEEYYQEHNGDMSDAYLAVFHL